MRIALLEQGGEQSSALVAELRTRGHDPRTYDAVGHALVDRFLQRRGFVPSLTALPQITWALRRRPVDLAYACSPVTAAAVFAVPVGVRPALVFAIGRPPERETLAGRRLALPMLSRALDGCAALVAPDGETADAVRRWLAQEPIIAPGTAALADLFESLAE